MNEERDPDADLLKLDPEKPRRALYWVSAIVIHLFAVWYLVEVNTLPRWIVKLNAKEHREIVDRFIVNFEEVYPNPDKSLWSLIPSDWAPIAAQYSFYTGKICREIEGRERVCDNAKGNLIASGLLGQFGLLIGAAEMDPEVAQEWVKASHMMLNGASSEVELAWGCKWATSSDRPFQCYDRGYLTWFYSSYDFKKSSMIMRVVLLGLNSLLNFSLYTVVPEVVPFLWALNCYLNSMSLLFELMGYETSSLFTDGSIRHGTYVRALICYSVWAVVHPVITAFFPGVNWI